MDDRRLHFLTMLGDTAASAGVARIAVDLFLRDGRNLRGALSAQPADDLREVDETGYSKALLLDGRSVDLEEVTGFAVFSP